MKAHGLIQLDSRGEPYSFGADGNDVADTLCTQPPASPETWLQRKALRAATAPRRWALLTKPRAAMATQSKKPRSVDEYIAQFEPPIKAILECVRAAVREGAPSATEVISYRMPAFRQNGILVYFAAFNGHIGLYPPIRGDAKLEARASAYAGKKGNLRFSYTEPIPYKLITALTTLRAKQDRYTIGRMKSYASFDEYLKAQSPKNQAIIRALRKFVQRVAPTLSEAVKWGNGCWIGSKGPVAYVYSGTQYVQFGFFNGSSLRDPKDLLEGKGKYVRHIKIGSPSAIDQPAFAALLLQAARSR